MIPYASDKKDDEVSIASSYHYEQAKNVKWYHRVLLNRPLKVITALLLVTILAPLLIYQYVLYASMEFAPPDGHSFGSCVVPRVARLPCGSGNVSESECHSQCCYDLQNSFCYHRVPSRFSYLVLPAGVDWTEGHVMIPRFQTVPYNSQPSIRGIKLSIDEISTTQLALTYYDSRDTPLNGSRIDDKTYTYQVSVPELSIVVSVNETTIFNTMRGPTIASDNVWEIAFRLTSQSMYGLGEIPLQPGMVKVVYNHEAGFSSVPLIIARTNGSYHGLLIDTVAPTEVRVTDDNRLVLRSLTTTGIKLRLFTGPEPKDIMREVLGLIGTPTQLDYWMLGAHVCSDVSSDDEEALSHLTSFISNATAAGIPYESHCGIRPITLEAEADPTPVVDGANALRNAQKRFVPHISPYVRYEIPPTNSTSNETNSTETSFECTSIICNYRESMLRSPSEELYVGTAFDYTVVYPDYSTNTTELLDILWKYDIELDGAVIENSWPLDDSFKAHNETELPYFSEDLERAFNKTPHWDTRTPNGDFFFHNHNAYGNNFLDALKRKLDQTSLLSWSSSQWMRTDSVVNRQDVTTSWLSLRNELVAAALGGVSGHWRWSSPICGDTENFDIETQAVLCIKWYMAGAYLPMIKVHSKTFPRDALAFEGTRRNLIKEALNQRMSLMPYFYTVLQEGPLLRPMFYQFPYSELVDLNTQFSVGDDLLIAPNLQPMQSHVHVQMPEGTWYEFWSGLRIHAEEGEMATLTTTEADFITLVRGGSIVPIQKDVSNTAESTRKNSDLTLVVATELVNMTTTSVIETYYATGQLFISPNLKIHFSVEDNQLLITGEGEDYTLLCGETAVWTSTIRDVDIYGLPDGLNNFDNHRNVNVAVDLCGLQTQNITVTLY